MKALIGVTASMELDETSYMTSKANTDAIKTAGGIPVILPYMKDINDINMLAEKLDGLYATGGYDINPLVFGEEPHPNLGTIIPDRDTFEIQLIQNMLTKNKPVLAVCRGCQILNLAAGGDMYQDIYEQVEGRLLQHQQQAPKGHGSHFVTIEENSLLHQITNSAKIRVNSRHHQANRSVNLPFQISGRASDGIVEAIESTVHPFVLGLQWHPENMLAAGDAISQKIYHAFVKACLS